MWWKWLIFALIIIIVPFGVGCFSLYVKKKNKLTQEQEKTMYFNMAKYWLFYWLCDLFYMSFIIDSISCKYIFGGFILLIVFYNLTMSFLSSTKKDALQRVGLLQDFVVGMALTIYLIYIIPGKQVEINGVVTVDNSLRDIITRIVAALYGGLLTLVGVAWTIKNGEKNRQDDLERIKTERQEEERKKNVPYVALVQKTSSSGEKLSDYCINIKKGKENSEFYYRFSPFTIKNISNNHIFLVGIKINEKINYNSVKKLVEKDASLNVSLSHSLWIDCELNTFNLIIEDILGNKYLVQCRFVKHFYEEKYESAPYNNIHTYKNMFRCEIQSVELPILQKE